MKLEFTQKMWDSIMNPRYDWEDFIWDNDNDDAGPLLDYNESIWRRDTDWG